VRDEGLASMNSASFMRFREEAAASAENIRNRKMPLRR